MSVLSLPSAPANAHNGDMYYNTVEQEYYNFVDGEWVKQVNEDNATSIVQEVVVDEGYLKNTATGTNSLTVGGTSSSSTASVNVGIVSVAGSGAVAVGEGASASGLASIVVGFHGSATAQGAIVLGNGLNTEQDTLKVALNHTNTQSTDEASGLYTLLNSDGTIPTGRYKVMVGADGTTAGTKGVVPAPTATDNTKFLRGDGTWAEVQSADSLPDQTGHAGEFLTTDGTDASWSEIKQSLWSVTAEEFKNQTCDLYAWSRDNVNELAVPASISITGTSGNYDWTNNYAICSSGTSTYYLIDTKLNISQYSFPTAGYVTVKNNKFILLPRSTTALGLYESTDGINWSLITDSTLPRNDISPSLFKSIGNVLVAFYSGPSPDEKQYSMSSSDGGETWVEHDFGTSFKYFNNGYIVNDKLFVYSSSSYSTIYTTDGVNWTQSDLRVIVDCYANGTYYGHTFGSPAYLYTSSNGTNWAQTEITLPKSGNNNILSYSDGYFVCIGATGSVNYSTDLSNWETYTYKAPSSTSNYVNGFNIFGYPVITITRRYSGVISFNLQENIYTFNNNPSIGDKVYSFYTPLGDTFINSVSSNKINVGGYEFDRNTSKDLEDTTLSLSNIDKNVVANVKDIGYFHSDDIPCLSKPILSKDEENELLSKGSLYGVYQKYNSKFSTESGLKTFKYTNKYEIHFNKPFKPIQNEMYYPCFGNNVFVSIASSGSVYSYSSDGITWNGSTLSHATGSSLKFINGMFITPGKSTDMYISTSSDGITWSSYSVPHTVSDIAYGNNKYVYLPSDVPSAKYTSFYYSSDLTSWTEITHPDIATYGPSMICFGNNMFVSVAYSSSTAIKSSDGITWTEFTMPMSGCDFFECINGKFYALFRDSSKGLITEDCINWTEFTLPKAARWGTIVYGNNKFITLTKNSNSNACAVSYDGINWFENEYPNDPSLSYMYMYGACYGNNKFVVGLASNGISYASQENSLSLEQETYTIPTTDFSSSSTQTLKNVNGTIKWVTDS